MAWTLEAVLVVPLAIGLTSLGLVAAGPLYADVRRAGRLEVLAANMRLTGDRIYEAACLSVDCTWTTGLRTSPQKILEAADLIKDGIRQVKDLLPDKDKGSSAAAMQKGQGSELISP
ncbi:MAG: hypothetical protein VB070_01960 [Clostridiaceae bacterium]|nr:hypothetical protein [Clostridiaceae bacterium]